MDKIFGKQIGYLNYLIKGLIIKKFKYSLKEKFIYKTCTNSNYTIYKWDPSGHEVYLTSSFTDWGNEYIFLNSLSEREKGIFIDVGCHTGYYPCLFQNFFFKIIGFEPNSKCINILKNLKIKNFKYYQNFVGDLNIEVNSTSTSDGWSFYDIKEQNNSYTEKIKQITLNDFCESNNLKNITAIKIDVDGIDLKVLYGADKIIRENRPSILIENYSNELFDYFNDLNYSFYSLVSSKSKPYNMTLENLKFFDQNKWIKMVCCIPNEYEKKYNINFFQGNLLTGINKKEIVKAFL